MAMISPDMNTAGLTALWFLGWLLHTAMRPAWTFTASGVQSSRGWVPHLLWPKVVDAADAHAQLAQRRKASKRRHVRRV